MEKKTNSLWKLFILLFFAVSFTGCDVIGDVFKSGVVVGVVIALAVLGAIIAVLASRK